MVLFPIALLRVAIVLVYAIRRSGQEPIDPPKHGPDRGRRPELVR